LALHELITIYKLKEVLPKKNLPSLFIRTGVAFTFLFAALSAYLYPVVYLQYFPDIILANIPARLLLHLFGIYEVLLALWLLSRKWPRASALVATVTIFMITIVNVGMFNVVFRNVAIFFSCIALYFLESPAQTLPMDHPPRASTASSTKASSL
jgi:hypothetical protein